MTRVYLYLLLPIWLISLPASVQAQQAAQYSLYMLNPFGFNPAWAGMDNTLVATGTYRQQWSGLLGAPVGQHINAHLPVYALNSGVGMLVENDAVGAHRSTRAALSFSHQIGLGKTRVLSFGGSAGFMQYALDGQKLRAPEGTYDAPGGVVFHNDPNLPEGRVTAGTPVFAAGVVAVLDRLQVGAALQPAFAPTLTAKAGAFRLQTVQQVILHGDYRFGNHRGWTVQPSFLLKTDITETQLEISSRMQWQENIFAGLSWRGIGPSSRDALVLFGGFRLSDKTQLAYAYDVTLSSLKDVNQGSHELLLRYSLNKPIGAGKLPPIIYNPRFF